MSPCCCEEGKIKYTLALGTACCTKPPGGEGEEIERVRSGYSEIQERNFAVHVLIFKSHTFYFKPVPLYLPKERGETKHSICRGFSPGNPHISSTYTADVAQSCQVTSSKHSLTFDSNPAPQKFPEKLPCSVRFLIFPIGCATFQLSANYINTQIQTPQNRQCPEAPAAGKQTSLNNAGREAKEVRKHPWATSHC